MSTKKRPFLLAASLPGAITITTMQTIVINSESGSQIPAIAVIIRSPESHYTSLWPDRGREEVQRLHQAALEQARAIETAMPMHPDQAP